MIFDLDPLIFAAWIYGFVGALFAALWFSLSRGLSLSAIKRAVGFLLYFFFWPVMIGMDVWQAIKIEWRMRAAYKRKGAL